MERPQWEINGTRVSTTIDQARAELSARCNAIEECYEYMLAYAAQGLPSDQGSGAGAQVRDHLHKCDAALVDLSTVGAQVVSPTVLKPNQRVRVVLGEGKGAVKCSGAIAWAAFEMPKGMPTRYRAGIDFGTDAPGVDTFAKKHKKAEKS